MFKYLCVLIFLSGCAQSAVTESRARSQVQDNSVSKALAVMNPTKKNKAKGRVEFLEVTNGVLVTATIEGLKPNSKHGFHIHEFGNCTSDDAKSAGNHFNPDEHQHAGPQDKMRHAGDLGNLVADSKGQSVYSEEFKDMSLSGNATILGRSIIIHASEDDFKTQPTGNAGDRIACGVIGVAAEKK